MSRLLLLMIKGYQRWLSPLLPPACRFEPTCSSYALVSIESFGPLRGGWMAICRLARCQPFCTGGYDPVPGTEPRGQR